MARKRRRRKAMSAGRRRKSVTTVVAPRRGHKTVYVTSPRKRRKSRGLSEMNLVKGKMGKFANPIIEGAAGGVGGTLTLNLVPKTWLATQTPANQKWIKRGALAAAAVAAAYFDQPLVSAGVAGFLAGKILEEEGVLQDDAPNGRFMTARYADPYLLSGRSLLSNRGLLSEGERIYPEYRPLYDDQTGLPGDDL